MPEQCCETFLDPGLDEVEVDQRALMNILSRYPGTFDVLRELVQNADDADARNVEVHFQPEVQEAETSGFASTAFDVSKVNVCKWTIKNDGNTFTPKDWERLGRIADGNDNSTKVGVFGVGFYSVLSRSDRPLVISNGESLQFFRGDDGKLRKKFIVRHSEDPRTTVELELRVPEPLPVLADLARFLVSSVAFLANIESISVYIEGHSETLMCIQKESIKPMDDVSLPPYLTGTTESQTLIIESIQRTVQKITIDAEDWIFTSSSTSSSSLVDATDTVPERPGPPAGGDDHPTYTPHNSHPILDKNVITHDLYTATVRVNLHPDSEMRRGVESSIKSLPPSFECKALYFNSQQHESLTSPHIPKAQRLAHIVSGPQGIFPEGNSGRLFIGQSTNQTTGIGLHLSGHFLSTMERGSIDLANGQVAAWNREVLWVGGFLARIIYEEEMGSAKSKDGLATQVGLYTMDRFAFGSASPHSGVSQILEDAFFSSCHQPKSPFPVVSDTGISCLSNSRFRKSHKDLSFVKKCRVLHEKVEPRQLSEIIKRYNIPMFQYTDIVQEFEAGVPLDTLRVFFEWWEGASKTTPPTENAKFARERFCKAFPSRGVLRSTHGSQVEIVLKKIKYFTFLPLPDDLSPPDTICIEVKSGIPTKANVECFGWSQLPLLHWLKHACSGARRLPIQENSRKDLDAGYRVLRILVQFALIERLSREHWNQVAELMRSLECIPTTVGRWNSPENSYIEEANIVGDLPVVDEGVFLDIPTTLVAVERGFEHRPVIPEHVRNVLLRIGVHATMRLEDLVERLEVAASEQSNDRLLHHLAYSPHLLNHLKGRRIFCSETRDRLCAAKLYFPNDDVRRLGLPILALPPHSVTTGLLSGLELSGPSAIQLVVEHLGIQRYPSLNNIISLATSGEIEVRQFALQYFLSNLEKRYDAYKPDNFANVAFIPTKCGSLACPNEVLGSAVWEKLGFKQISPALRRDLSRLGIKDDPSVDTIVEYLKTPSRTLPDIATASVWFEHLYLHGKLPTPKLRDQLSMIPFVPVKKSNPLSPSTSLEYISPNECFIGQAEMKEHHRDIFPFVNFGQDGNNFLDSCCAKKSPDATDIARKIMQDPNKYLEALGNDTDLYLRDLRSIASQLDSISEEDKQAMQKAPMFLAFRKNKDDTKLLRADQVVIVDWGSREFGDNVFVPPKDDDPLEKMYCAMGSAFLGTFVRHDITSTGHKADCYLPFTHEQAVSRIRCFMYQRDTSRKADASFYDQGSTDKLRVRACKTLALKKVFAPPCGILPPTETRRTIETDPVQMKAGLEFAESDESCTLWMVNDSRESEALHYGIAVALCHVLLKTYGPNEVLLLASLFAKDDEGIKVYYGSEMKYESTCVPNTKVKSKKGVKFEVALVPFLAKVVGLVGIPSKPGILRFVGESTEPLEKAMSKAIESWGEDLDGPPDFSLPSRPRPSIKRHNGHCKHANAIRLKEKKNLCDTKTGIRFFIARDAQCQQPSSTALREFADLISILAHVFEREASRTCYIFWKDTDEDLMAFNRDQRYIFLNLAHYSKFSRDDSESDRKQVITEWYLIMAHEIAHNVTLDHDEYHGSLSSKIAVTYLPALHQQFSSVFCYGANTLPTR